MRAPSRLRYFGYPQGIIHRNYVGSYEIGAMGVELNLENGKIYAKGAYGYGFGISIDW